MLTGNAETLTNAIINAVLNGHSSRVVNLVSLKGTRLSPWIAATSNIGESLGTCEVYVREVRLSNLGRCPAFRLGRSFSRAVLRGITSR